MEKIYRRWKLIVGKNIRHLTKILSLFSDEVFPDKVLEKNKQSHQISINFKNKMFGFLPIFKSSLLAFCF